MSNDRKLWACSECDRLVGPVGWCECGNPFKWAVEDAYEDLRCRYRVSLNSQFWKQRTLSISNKPGSMK